MCSGVLYVYMCVFVQVTDIKEELGGLKERIEEMRGVCRQLQSQLKKFPDCSETSFEAEADSLMDNWLDVSVYAHTPNTSLVFLFMMYQQGLNSSLETLTETLRLNLTGCCCCHCR